MTGDEQRGAVDESIEPDAALGVHSRRGFNFPARTHKVTLAGVRYAVMLNGRRCFHATSLCSYTLPEA